MELLQIKILNTAVERMLNQEMAELGITYTQSTVIGYLIENQDKDVCQRVLGSSWLKPFNRQQYIGQNGIKRYA